MRIVQFVALSVLSFSAAVMPATDAEFANIKQYQTEILRLIAKAKDDQKKHAIAGDIDPFQYKNLISDLEEIERALAHFSEGRDRVPRQVQKLIQCYEQGC